MLLQYKLSRPGGQFGPEYPGQITQIAWSLCPGMTRQFNPEVGRFTSVAWSVCPGIPGQASQNALVKYRQNTFPCCRGTSDQFQRYTHTILKTNPIKKVPKRSTKFDSSRFKVFELDELKSVALLLSNDKAFIGLHTASKILFKYNIRPLEISRIQIRDINWEKRLLTLPPHKTKNGHEAVFLLDEDIIKLIKDIVKECDPDYFIFCKRNHPSPQQTFDDYFGQRWRAFRKKYGLSSHLKFYALKHTSNYYDIENGASYEEIRQRNRHSNLQITTLYIKERLFKNIIKSSSSTQF